MTINLSALKVGDKVRWSGIEGEHLVSSIEYLNRDYTYWIQFSTEGSFRPVAGRGHYHLNGKCLTDSSAFDIVEIIPGEVKDNDTISDDSQYGLNLSELCVGDKVRVQGNSEKLWEVTEIKIWEDGREYAYELGLGNVRFPYIYNILGGYKNSTKYHKEADIVEIIKKESAKETPKFKRNNAGKIAYSHLDPEFIESMIKVLMVNTYKDDSDGKPNWQNTPDNLNKDVLDSLWRHLNALYTGEVIDPTDGVPHAAKIAINAMIFNFHKKE